MYWHALCSHTTRVTPLENLRLEKIMPTAGTLINFSIQLETNTS